MLFRLQETEFQESIVQMYPIQGTVFLYGSIWFYFGGNLHGT